MFKWIKFLGIVQPLKRRKLWRVFEQGEPVSQKRTCRIREALKKKLRDYLGIFPKRRTPPPTPPFWEPLVQKKKLCLFCILGVKDHFCSSQKNHFLSGIFTTRFGNKGPPPPF